MLQDEVSHYFCWFYLTNFYNKYHITTKKYKKVIKFKLKKWVKKVKNQFFLQFHKRKFKIFSPFLKFFWISCYFTNETLILCIIQLYWVGVDLFMWWQSGAHHKKVSRYSNLQILIFLTFWGYNKHLWLKIAFKWLMFYFPIIKIICQYKTL